VQLSFDVVTSLESGAGAVSPSAKDNPSLPLGIAGLQADLLEHQVKPLAWCGVPESALHD